ncbi:MAG: methyltetrahydrofolate cobalamin methyltransferase [Deltaproteobacteria bacterium]|nr:methyltetrahydrofolate cobalamin methyltransferase [Deltaproteobacteria bacterium]MBW1861810.1 methyltetrahydrofolate cobalamin methyltransferase [Deltaproteobacteria bacterium]
MLIVGELINASRKKIGLAIESQDKAFIQKVASDQLQNGADYIDVNAGIFVGKEAEYLKWLVSTVQDAVEAPCCIDSPDPEAIEAALSIHKGTAIINSISLEKKRYDAFLPLLAGTDLKVVALCVSDEGMPETAEARIAIADKLINRLVRNNVLIDNIYVDPLVQPIATNSNFGVEFLKAIEKIMTTYEGIHTICGLSNISYGLPERKFMNQMFMVMAISKGLDAAIVDPLDKQMMAGIITGETLIGKDNFCMNFLKAYRAKKL